MDKIANLEVAEVFKNYPKHMRQKLMFVRQLILDTASEAKDINTLEEMLKFWSLIMPNRLIFTR